MTRELTSSKKDRGRPTWLTVTAPPPEMVDRMHFLLKLSKLNTVCDSACCPNLYDCYSRETATFLILGRICTRDCAFCAVPGGRPEEPDATEPENLARMVRHLGLKHVVITSVTRDDLPDGGAGQFVETINAVRRLCPGTSVEVLIPDFKGSPEAIGMVVGAGPDVIGHNLESVPGLYGKIRHQASYNRSLGVLATVKQINENVKTKSGIMLGLGEKEEELMKVLQDLRRVRCDYLTLGQYLQPSPYHWEVAEYVPPEKFDRYRNIALEMGFLGVMSSPLTRSSYRAGEMMRGPTGTG